MNREIFKKCHIVLAMLLYCNCAVATIGTTANSSTTATANGITWAYHYSASLYGYSGAIKGYWIGYTKKSGSTDIDYGSAIPTSTSGAVAIPSQLDGLSIRGIDYKAFDGCSKVTRITIPSSIDNICDFAFSGCSGLKVIVFQGNAPTFPSEFTSYPFNGVHSDCTAYVYPSSKGWKTTIPGNWKNIKIAYMKSVNFNANGGSVSADTRWRVDGDAVGSLPTPTRTQATFKGWYTAKTGGSKISSSTTISANKTFYAQWTINQYTVTFDANGGVGGTSGKMDYGATITAPAVTRIGYTFAGWSSTVASKVPANDVMYTAQWTPNPCEITFDATEGTGGLKRTQDYDSPFGELPMPTRTGYIFCGWFSETEGGDKITETSTVSGDKTYFAHWERDPIPEMVSGETVAEVLAGAADETLAAKLGTTRNYKNYRGWVDDKALEHKAVKESPNAWLAYALDAPGLIAKPSAVAKEDFTFEAGSSVAEEPGKMAFDFGIDGVTIGEEAELDEVFAITGAATLEESAFTESGITASLERTSDGNVSVSVEPPKDGNGKIPDKYFFRVKVK